ncbi:MAG: nucleotidyltransferase family protein [Omnitrophica WOR_2 bacterium]
MSQEQMAMPATALVLAGGFGTRLRQVLPHMPKVLAPVAGRPFLDYVLTYLANQGILRVVLCTGYLAEQVEVFAGEGRRWNLEVSYSRETVPLGTAGALKQASRSQEGSFIALNGDTLFLADLKALWEAHRINHMLATVALLPVPDGRGRGCVTVDKRVTTGNYRKILSFDEKPGQPQPALINAGVYVLEPEALAGVLPDQPVSIERQVFPRLAAAGKLGGAIQSAYFTDIGTPESLADFEKDLANDAIPDLNMV